MITCPNPSCEQPVPEDALFCPSCGTSIQAATDASDESFVGRVLNQKYRLTEQLAEGGMAIVYKAQRIFFDDICAVKIIKKGLSSKEEMLKRFQREAKLTNKVARRSPFIIDIYDFGVEDGVGFYYVMELLNGYPFAELLKNVAHPPPAQKMVRYVCQMCEGLAVVHEEGLVHRDIKPDNIFLHRDSNTDEETIKLLDFGIARPTYAKATMLTNYGRVMGTPEYMSPEQCRGPTPEQYERGESHLDGRSDIYSLGVLLYQGLTGEVPFPMVEDGGPMAIHKVMAGHVMEEPVPPLEKRPDLDISPALSGVALKALAKEPRERFQTMLEFRDALLSCFPELLPEFRGVSNIESNAPELDTIPRLEESAGWQSNVPPSSRVDAFGPTAASTPGVEAANAIALDRTALDVQLPDSILEEAQRWAEANPEISGYSPRQQVGGGLIQASQGGGAVGQRNPNTGGWANPPTSHTFDNPSEDFDMSKTVAEPMAPEIMAQLQQQAEAAIRAENAGARLPFSARHQRQNADTAPSPLQKPTRSRNWGKLIFVVLLFTALGVGGYLAYVQFFAS